MGSKRSPESLHAEYVALFKKYLNLHDRLTEISKELARLGETAPLPPPPKSGGQRTTRQSKAE